MAYTRWAFIYLTIGILDLTEMVAQGGLEKAADAEAKAEELVRAAGVAGKGSSGHGGGLARSTNAGGGRGRERRDQGGGAEEEGVGKWT